MQIRPSIPRRSPGPRPRGDAKPLLPLATGAVLAAPAVVLGVELAKEYGWEIADTMVRKGIPLVTGGHVSMQTALKVLPYLRDRAFHMSVGGVAFGLAGFAVGAAVGVAILSAGD